MIYQIKKRNSSIHNNQFSSVFVTEKNNQYLPDFPYCTYNRLADLKIDSNNVENVQTKLYKNIACG